MFRMIKNDLIGKLLYPENPNFDGRATKSRALVILVENLCSDLSVYEVCLHIIRYLK